MLKMATGCFDGATVVTRDFMEIKPVTMLDTVIRTCVNIGRQKSGMR